MAIQASEISYPDAPDARVFHLVQGRSDAVLQVCSGIPRSDLVLAIAYDREISPGEPGAEADQGRRVYRYWPKSSWAEGRNLGWEVALGLGDRIDYAAFLDDDVVFEKGDYASFVSAVLEFTPDIAVPVVPRTNRAKYILPDLDLQSGSIQDQQVMLLHRDVLMDRDIWPMAVEYDEISWHVPCIIQEYMIFERYKGRLAQFNRFGVRNDGHTWEEDEAGAKAGGDESAYVMERDFHRVRRLAYDHVEKLMGRRPDVANDIFNSIKGVTPMEKARRLWWKNLGRTRHMRRLTLRRAQASD